MNFRRTSINVTDARRESIASRSVGRLSCRGPIHRVLRNSRFRCYAPGPGAPGFTQETCHACTYTCACNATFGYAHFILNGTKRSLSSRPLVRIIVKTWLLPPSSPGRLHWRSWLALCNKKIPYLFIIYHYCRRIFLKRVFLRNRDVPKLYQLLNKTFLVKELYSG